MTKLNDRQSSTMRMKGAVVLGVLALVASAGCATSSRTVGVDTRMDGGAAVQASPAAGRDAAQSCERYGGWYDRVAGACDSDGE